MQLQLTACSSVATLSLRFFLQDLHGNGNQPIQLVIRCPRKQRLGPEVVFACGVPVEQATEERDQRNPLELRAAARFLPIVVRAEQGLEAVRVAQRFRGERRDHLTEANVALGERLGLTLRAQEDGADDGGPPSNRHHDDRAHVTEIECRPRILQHGIVRRVGDEHRVARLERSLELRVPIQIDDEVPDRRVFVARDQPDLGVSAGQVDRAPIERERLAELAGDRLQNVYEMERGRNVLQDVDDRDELITLALKLRDPLPQLGRLRLRLGIALDR